MRDSIRSIVLFDRVEFTEIYSHRFLTKISWKQRFLETCRFHGIFAKKLWWWEHTVEKREILSHQKFLSNQLFSNLFSIIVTFTEFLRKNDNDESTLCGKTRNSFSPKNFFSSNQQLSNLYLVKSLLSRNFYQKKREMPQCRKYGTFPPTVLKTFWKESPISENSALLWIIAWTIKDIQK